MFFIHFLLFSISSWIYAVEGHGNEISPATPAGFGPLQGGPVILLTFFEARVEHDVPSTRAWSMVGQRVALYWLSACPRLRWPEIVGRVQDDLSMEVIPERAEMLYLNPKYVYQNMTVTVRRYSRRAKYFINVAVTLKQTFTNNVTFDIHISQLLHNEYRRSFVSLSYKFCDLMNSEPYIGGALKKAGLICPAYPGFHNIANMTAQTQLFPNVFPFEKGRVEFTVRVTDDTKEPIIKLNIYASFKQKI